MDDFSVDSIVDSGNDSGLVEVISPSGNPTNVMNEAEAKTYNNMAARYQNDNSFSNVSDLAELDRILTMELMCHRWSQWILMESDYDGRKVDPSNLQKSIETYSKEIRGIKKDLGMDKSSRDKDQQSNVADYIENLRLRAKQFGVHRDEQGIMAITMLKEIRALVTLHDNSSDAERREFECNVDDILEFIRSKGDQLDDLDAKFRQDQKMWVRTI